MVLPNAVTGNIIWQFARDIITNIVLQEEWAELAFMDSARVRLHQLDGSLVPFV
jgi:hypothetical protein